MNKIVITIVGLVSLFSGCGGSGAGSTVAPVQLAFAAAIPSADVNADDPSVLSAPGDDPVAEDADGSEEVAANFALEGYAPPGPNGQPDSAAASAPLLESDATRSTPSPEAGGRMDLFVATNGSDNNKGSAQEPLRSISKAAKAAKPGTRIFVAPGVYSGGFRTSVDGSATARISFVSTTRWGARIVPPRNSPNKTAWDNRGSNVDIVGFELDGSNYLGGTRWAHGIYNGGSYVSIRRNHVHHIAQADGCSHAGGAAIGMDSYYGGVRADVVSNLVHDIGPAGCRYVQGIYMSTSGRVKNNVIYRVAEGGIHLWHDASNVVITNNTVTKSHTGIIVGGGNFYHSSKGNDDTAVYSNIVFDNKMGISEQGKTGPNNSYRNNLVYQNAEYNWRLKNGIEHTETVRAPPGFVANARSSQPNLKLSGQSAAIGKATPEQAESTDFEGKPRNAISGFDIGAYQH